MFSRNSIYPLPHDGALSTHIKPVAYPEVNLGTL